jgi:hypothetical protein
LSQRRREDGRGEEEDYGRWGRKRWLGRKIGTNTMKEIEDEQYRFLYRLNRNK